MPTSGPPLGRVTGLLALLLSALRRRGWPSLRDPQVVPVLLAVVVRHDARTGDSPTGAAATLAVLVAAVAVIVLFSTGIALVGITGLLSVAADS